MGERPAAESLRAVPGTHVQLVHGAGAGAAFLHCCLHPPDNTGEPPAWEMHLPPSDLPRRCAGDGLVDIVITFLLSKPGQKLLDLLLWWHPLPSK